MNGAVKEVRMLKTKNFKAKVFLLKNPNGTKEKLNEMLKNSNNGVYNTICVDEKKTHLELTREDENVFFITINRHKTSSVPVVYNEKEITGITVNDDSYLGELYYARVNTETGVITAVSFLGASLESSLDYAFLCFAQNNPFEAALDLDKYENFKNSSNIRAIKYKLSFEFKGQVEQFLQTSFGATYGDLLDNDNLSLEISMSAGKNKRGLSKEVLNITDNLMGCSHCTKLVVKYNENEENVEIDLKKPRIVFSRVLSYEEFLKKQEAKEFLSTAEYQYLKVTNNA